MSNKLFAFLIITAGVDLFAFVVLPMIFDDHHKDWFSIITLTGAGVALLIYGNYLARKYLTKDDFKNHSD